MERVMVGRSTVQSKPLPDVLIGSTSADLSEHRQIAIDILRRYGLTVIEGETNDPFTARELVDSAGAFVCILGGRYGYVPRSHNPDKYSILEIQYRHALERGIPILAFISAHETARFAQTAELKEVSESGAKSRQKQKLLNSEIAAHHDVRLFTSPETLAERMASVLESMGYTLQSTAEEPHQAETVEENGEAVEGGEELSADAPIIGTIPFAPHPYIAHLFIPPRRFFGRAYEIGVLNNWMNGPEPCLLIEALSGIGKSTLAWRWFREQTSMGRVWWNFQDSPTATITNFVRCTLAYITGQALNTVDAMSPEARQTALINALRARPFLIILDGVERLLAAYHRMDAPYLADCPADEKSLRWSNPAMGAFFKNLVDCSPSKVLMLTRHKPGELSGVREMHLRGLTMVDSLALLRSLGVQTTPEVLSQCIMHLEAHPLALRVLAGCVSRRDFEEWWDEEGRELIERFSDPVARRASLIHYALDDLLPPSLHMLTQIGVFRFAVDTDTINAANPFVQPRPPKMSEPRRWQQGYVEAKAAWDAYQQSLADREAQMRETQPQLKGALDDLEGRGLLLHDRNTDKIDLHSLVRGSVIARGDDLRAAYVRARDYYESLPPDRPEDIRELSDARRAVEIYYSTLSAGLLPEAAEVYRTHLARLARKAAHYEVIELLSPLFSDGLRTLPPLPSARDRGYFANELALALGSVGQRNEAMSLLAMAFGQFCEEDNPTHLCAALLNYAGLMRDDNQIAAKAHVFELARELATAANDTENLATANLFLLKIYADTGQWEKAEAAYRAFSANPPRIRTAYRQASAERNFAKMQVYRQQDPTGSLALALQFAQESRSTHEQLSIFALWGETSLQQNRPDAAEKFFRSALDMATQTGAATANYAGGLARALARQGRLDEARLLVAKGVSRAAAAEVLLALGEKERAARLAIEAYKLAWADGAPFSFWMELAQAKKTLAALNLPEPRLPPFDPASVKPIPNEAEIRAYIEYLNAQPKAAKVTTQTMRRLPGPDA